VLVYRVIQSSLRLVLSVFYRQVEIVGLEHVPDEGEGPVIFAGNHPNSLLDPALITTSCGRIVHFAAKDVLFKSRPLRVVLDAMGAVPIARRADHGGTSIDNSEAFDGLFRVLGQGRAMGIFPEGLSHDEAQLARLKTGAARIALGAFEKHPEQPIKIVPCGLNYMNRKRFRSRVLVQFGPPIVVDQERLARWKSDDREEVRALTSELETAMRALTINASDWDTLRVIDGVRRLYQPPNITLEERVELSRRFTEAYKTLSHREDVSALLLRVRAYLDRLAASGLSDRDLRRAVSAREALGRFFRHSVFTFVWLPLAAPGLTLFLPAGLAIRLLAPVFAPRRDVIGTTKFVLGLLALVAMFAAVPFAATWRWGAGAGALSVLALLVSGYASLQVLARTSALKSVGVTFGRLLFLRQELEALREERSALEAAVVDAVGRLRPAEMTPLFPERAGQGRPKDEPK
jgi:glycerol-3-phosphate O-acyltransferase/dihydroxyacetone phosphate acyltransferase